MLCRTRGVKAAVKKHKPVHQSTGFLFICLLVRLAGIEPALPAPEAGALSPELQAHFIKLAGLLLYYI